MELLVLVFAAGGAWAGVRYEMRALSARLAGIERKVRNCPHHHPHPQPNEV